MTFEEWFKTYPLPAEIDSMDETDREQWTWALRSAYKTGMKAERDRLHDKFMEMHKSQQQNNNYWHFAARKISEENT